MHKLIVYVEAEVDAALARRAAAEGVTKTELMRRVLREAAEGHLRVKPRAVGVFAGPADLSTRTDEHLAESGFGESA